MRVLLTNDDGIQATGLNALRRELREIDRPRGARDRAGLEPQRHRAQHHDPLAAVGRGGRLRRRLDRLRHRRHPGRLRALRRARPGRRAARADRLGHQPRLQPRRRHHLLGHRRRRARGDRARASRRSRSRSSPPRGRWTSAGAASSTSRSPPRSRPSWCGDVAQDPLPPDTLLNVNCPAGEPTGIEVTHLGKRLYNDELKLVEEDPKTGRNRYQIYGFEPSLRGRGRLRPLGDRPGADLGHARPLRPHRPRRASIGSRLGLRPGCSAGPRRPPSPRRLRRSGDGTEGGSEAGRGAAAADRAPRPPLLRPRRPRDRRTPTTTTCSASCAGSRRSIPSCSRPTRRPSGSGERRSTSSSRSSTTSRCSRSATPATRRSSAPGRNASSDQLERLDIRAGEIRYVDRAEDRRSRDLADLRERRLHPRRDARRRADRRGRHPEPADDQGDPAEHRGRAASWSRSAARSTCRSRGFARLNEQRAAGRRVRPSPTRATRPPGRCASSTRRSPPTRPLSIWCYGVGGR